MKKEEAACRQRIEELNEKIAELQKTSETFREEIKNLQKKSKEEEERANELRGKSKRMIKCFKDVKRKVKCIRDVGAKLYKLLVKQKNIFEGEIREFKSEGDRINKHVKSLKWEDEEQKKLSGGFVWLTSKIEMSKTEKHVKLYKDANKSHRVMIPIEEYSAKSFGDPIYNSTYF